MSIDNIDNNVKDMILASNDLGLLSARPGLAYIRIVIRMQKVTVHSMKN